MILKTLKDKEYQQLNDQLAMLLVREVSENKSYENEIAEIKINISDRYDYLMSS